MPFKDPEKKKENQRKNYIRRKSLGLLWSQKNPKEHKEYNRNWWKKNYPKYKDKKSKYLLSWRVKNPEKVLSCHLRYKFHITKDWYDYLLNKQNGKCDICKNSFNINFTPHVDHCHKTNKIRGLLCRKCNTLLANANDNIEILNSAIKYLNVS